MLPNSILHVQSAGRHCVSVQSTWNQLRKLTQSSGV